VLLCDTGILLAAGNVKDHAELVETYLDLPLGIVDAAVAAIAERLGLAEIATLDHRHFTVIRPRHVQAFTLLPGPGHAVS
jgi:hypothetical protein